MKYLNKILTIGIITTSLIPAHSQIEGLWGVEKVTVGSQIMTPLAKWTRINADASFQSGNGWLQNSEGTWSFNAENMKYTPLTHNGLDDPFGAFTVALNDDKMTWSRIEEGEKVVVYLERIKAIPKGPADTIQGLWDLWSVSNKGVDISSSYDPDSKRYMFIRWDRIFIDDLGPDGRLTGYWQMHGHRPLLTLISHDESKVNQQWTVEFTTMEMI